MDQSHKVILTDNEMFLVLQCLDRRVAQLGCDKRSRVYQDLHDRLERIYEGRE